MLYLYVTFNNGFIVFSNYLLQLRINLQNSENNLQRQHAILEKITDCVAEIYESSAINEIKWAGARLLVELGRAKKLVASLLEAHSQNPPPRDIEVTKKAHFRKLHEVAHSVDELRGLLTENA